MWAVTHNVFSGVRFNTDSFIMWLYAPRGPCDVLRDSSQFELISLPTKMLC